MPKASYGLSTAVFTPIKNGAYTTGISQKWSRAITREVSQELTKFFADNKVIMQVFGVKEITGEYTAYQIDKSTYKEFLGFHEELNTALSDGAIRNNCAIQFLVKLQDENNKITYRLFALYDNTLTEPSIEYTTTEDAVELVEMVIPYQGKVSDFVKNGANEYISYMIYDIPYGYTVEAIEQKLLLKVMTPQNVGTEFPSLDQTPPVITTVTSTINWTIAEDGTKTFNDVLTASQTTANDDVDGDITNLLVPTVNGVEHELTDFVDLSIAGDQIVTFNVADSSNNPAIPGEVTITVT